MAQQCLRILKEEAGVQEIIVLSLNTGFDITDFFGTYKKNKKGTSKKIKILILQCAKFMSPDIDLRMRLACGHLFLAMAGLGTAMDTLQCYLEVKLNEEADSAEIIVILKCFEKCLSRMPVLRDHIPVCQCFNSVIRHMNYVETNGHIPSIFFKFDNFYERLIDFIQFIFNEIVPKLKISNSDKVDLNNNIIVFLLKLLGKPMACMPFDFKSPFKHHIEIIIKHIYLFNSNLLRYMISTDSLSESDNVTDCDISLNLGMLYYYIIHEGIYFDKLPQVYNSVFIFNCLLKHLFVMLNDSSTLVQRKSLLLSITCLNCISHYSIKLSDMNRSSFSRFCKILPINIMSAESNKNRQIAITLFRKLIECLDSNARYIVLLNLSRLYQQSAPIGYLTTVVKGIVANCISTRNNIDLCNFRGKKLMDILKIVTKLPDEAKIGVSVRQDAILSSLNFLNYVILKDTNNLTGIWNYTTWIKNNYLKPLERVIETSKPYYELEKNSTDQHSPEFSDGVIFDSVIVFNNYSSETVILDVIDSLRIQLLENLENNNKLLHQPCDQQKEDLAIQDWIDI